MNIEIYGADVLRQMAEPVKNIDQRIVDLTEQMLKFMYASDGIGLAAPQIGLSEKLFVCHAPGDQPRAFINPEIVGMSQEQVSMEEGCLSIPGVYGPVSRARSVQIQGYDPRGKIMRMEASGMTARVILHEFDHLVGKMFVDYLSDRKREKLLKKMEKGLGRR